MSCGFSLFHWIGAFNLFLFGNLSHHESDVRGRVAVGGDAEVSSYEVGRDAHLNPFKYPYSFIVDGKIRFHAGTVWGGMLTYGTSSYIPQSVSAYSGHFQKRPLSFSEAREILHNLSQRVLDLSPQGETKIMGKTTTLKVPGTLGVFDLEGDIVSMSSVILIEGSSQASAWVRIHGASVKMNRFDYVFEGISSENVVFFFPEATHVDLKALGGEGVFFAPNASVDFTDGNWRGLFIAKDFKGDGQINQAGFSACLP